MNKENRAKKGLERLLWNVVFWSADIYVGMGFCYSMQKILSTRDTKEDSMHLFWSAMERPTLVQYRKIEGHRLRFEKNRV